MLIKNKDIEIDEEYIFKNDALNRKETIIDLSKLLLSTTEPFVFSINGSWGTGKTTFVKLWQSYLKQEHDVHSLYFSAWEDDFSNEPLIAILGSLNGYIEENFKDNDEVIDKFNQAKEFGGKVLKRGLPAFVKGVTGGVLELDKGLESAIGAITEETAKGLIENYSKEKEVTEQFKKSINELLELLDSEQPFIIFIDELDRCRPLYAIELLERIKHIFGIEKLIFVLSIDKEQLSESIKSQYGNIDTDNYLRRFIDLEYRLSNMNIDKFCNVLLEKFEIKKILIQKSISIDIRNSTFIEMLKKLVIVFDLSLRQIEQVFSKLNILFKIIEPKFGDAHLKIFVFFELLKSYNSDWYFSLTQEGKKKEEIKDFLLPKLKEDEKPWGIDMIIEMIIEVTLLEKKEYQEFVQKQKTKLDSLERTSQSFEYERIGYSMNLLDRSSNHWGDYTLNKQIDKVIRKIEFLDEFNMEVK